MTNIIKKIALILRWSEKYTKADMVYFAKGSFWVTFGQTLSSVLSLLLAIAFANLLPKETYGMYRYVLSLASILNIFTLTGMNNAVSRSVASGNEGSLKESVRYQFKWNLLMLLSFFTLSFYYFLNENFVLALSFIVLGVFVPPTLALNTYGAYLEGKKEFKVASITSIVSTFVYVIGVFVSILLSGEVVWLIVAYSLTTFISTLFFYFLILKKYKPNTKIDTDTLEYGRKLTFIGFIGPVASQIDKIIITHFWGATQLAIYSLAMAVPERVTGLIKNWVGIGFPKFSTKSTEEINAVFYRRIFQGISIGFVVAIFYILVAPYLFKYLLPQYIDSIFFSQLLAISFVFAMPNRYISLLLVSQKLSRPIFINSIIQNIIKILFYAIFGLWGGILGLVVANILHSLVSMIINIIVWKVNSKN